MTTLASTASPANRRLLFIGDQLPQLKAEMYTSRRAAFVRLYQECERGSAVQFKPTPPQESTTWAGIGVMNRALQDRDPPAARRAVEAHLDYVEAAVQDQQKFEKNEAIARLRFEREKSR